MPFGHALSARFVTARATLINHNRAIRFQSIVFVLCAILTHELALNDGALIVLFVYSAHYGQLL